MEVIENFFLLSGREGERKKECFFSSFLLSSFEEDILLVSMGDYIRYIMQQLEEYTIRKTRRVFIRNTT